MKKHARAFFVVLREALRHKEPAVFQNREGLADYDFVLRAKTWRNGISAMIRVKNEDRKILYCLSSVIDVFDEIVLIDNGSTDSTVDRVRAFKRERDGHDKILLLSYPFPIARCGKEHRQTPDNSVNSLPYYYNWCLSQCHYSYVFKIDADMVLLPNEVPAMRRLLRQLSPFLPTIVEPAVQTTYRTAGGKWFLAKDEVNWEPRLFPNTSAIHYYKGKHSERLRCTIPTLRYKEAEILIYELKDTSEDEFGHWTDTNFPTRRKQREWRNFNLIKSGEPSSADFSEIDSSFLFADPFRAGRKDGSTGSPHQL